MTVTVQTTKVIAPGNGSATSFSFSPVVIYSSSNLVVQKLDVSANTYTTLAEGATSANYAVVVAAYPGTGSITYPAAAGVTLTSAYKLVMRCVLTIEQQIRLNNQGGYRPDVQERAFDRLTKICLQQQEEIDRCVKLAVGDTTTTIEDLAADLQTIADMSASVNTVAAISADVTKVAGISANVSTVAGISASILSVSANSANIVTVAGISANVSTVAGISANVTTVAGSVSDIGDVASISAAVNTVAGISANVTTVAVIVSQVVDVASISANVSTVAGISANVTSVKNISASVTTVAGISASILSVSANSANIVTVAGISANVSTVAGISANVSTVAGISASILSVSANSANIVTVAGISANVTIVAGISGNVITVAARSANIITLAAISANIITVAGISANVTTVAGISANVTTVAGISASVVTVATAVGTGSLTLSGNVTAGAIVVTGTVPPANGIYLPSANTVTLTQNSNLRLQLTSGNAVRVMTAAAVSPTYSFTNNGEGLFLQYNDDSGSRHADIVAIGNTPAGATMAMRLFVNSGGGAGTAAAIMSLDGSSVTIAQPLIMTGQTVNTDAAAVSTNSVSISVNGTTYKFLVKT